LLALNQLIMFFMVLIKLKRRFNSHYYLSKKSDVLTYVKRWIVLVKIRSNICMIQKYVVSLHQK
jgi:hypothetical protein